MHIIYKLYITTSYRHMGEAESATGNKKQRRKSALFGKWGVLILMSLAVFIIVIDTTIMNVAITALVHDLNTNIENEKFF